MKKIILDFDGTLTDAELEAQPYLEAYHRIFPQNLGMDPIMYNGARESIEAKLRADPTAGWVVKGHVVAPATSDPAALNTAVHLTLLANLPEMKMFYDPAKLPSDHGQFTSLVHFAAYDEAGMDFRDGSAQFVQSLLGIGDVTIVTNSKTDAVRKKLTALAEQSGIDELVSIPIIGDAQKYSIDPEWSEVELSMQPDGFPLPVVLRRKKYAQTLRTIAPNPREAVVIADNFHLDLSLPLRLGYSAVLTNTPAAEAHQIAYISKQSNGFYAVSYDKALAWIKNI